jgi:SAM-dependent methyltransferase
VESGKADSAAYSRRGINPSRLNAIQEYAGRMVLDVGCGSGAYVLHPANERVIYGVDHIAYPTWIERPDRFAVSTADRLPFGDASVDTILSFEVLEHVRDPGQALREYRRVTRQNIILTVPNCSITEGMRRSNLLYSHWSDRTHVNFFDLESICHQVSEAGFRVAKKRLINRMSLVPVLAEATGWSLIGRQPIRWLLELLLSRPYWITCLVVADKP